MVADSGQLFESMGHGALSPCAAGRDLGPAPCLKMSVPARPEQIARVRTEARRVAREQGALAPDDVALAVTEAVTNAVLHAYPPRWAGSVRLTAVATPTVVTFRVEDDGRGLRASTPAAGLGLGFGLMARLAQHFATTARPEGGTAVLLAFPLAQGPDTAAATADSRRR